MRFSMWLCFVSIRVRSKKSFLVQTLPVIRWVRPRHIEVSWCSLVGSGRRQPELHMYGVPDVITSPFLPWAENYVLVMTITLYVIHSSACRWWVRGMVVGTSLSLSRCLVHCVFRLHYSHGRRVDREFLTGTCL